MCVLCLDERLLFPGVYVRRKPGSGGYMTEDYAALVTLRDLVGVLFQRELPLDSFILASGS